MTMKALFATVLFFCLTAGAEAQLLNRFQWKSRVVVVFTPDETDPMFEEQFRLLRAANDQFEQRNVVFIFATPGGNHENMGIFLDEAAALNWYDYFNPYEYQMELVLVGLDGTEKYRARNRLTPASILLNLIDGMPLRQAEIMQGYQNKSMIEPDPTTSEPSQTRRRY